MRDQFDGKVCLVTGAGSGIGRACALILAREGAKVVVSDIVTEGGEETVRLIRKAVNEASFVKADVSKPSEVEGLINKIIANYGRIDCAVNNAGTEGRERVKPTADCTEENWDFVMQVNCHGFPSLDNEQGHFTDRSQTKQVHKNSIEDENGCVKALVFTRN